MKLIVEKGELNLPEDFSFEIEQNSAFFSEDGTASVAATIPATSADLDKLEHPTRIARNKRYANLFPAILSHGVFQKKGNLVVESASKDGITCAMALEDSEFYSKWKDTDIREIFGDNYISGNTTVDSCCDYLMAVYDRTVQQDMGLRIFPVAVNYNADKGTYQINNEPAYGNNALWPLLYESRIIEEGNSQVSVPKGYGLAPFLLLSRFLDRLFYYAGYTVRQNCFTGAALNKLVLLHQCSDVVRCGKIKYADLIPSKTVAEIIEWINAKFHAQIVVYPSSKMVDIVLLEDILKSGFDMDLTGKLIGNITHSFSQPSRVVLRPDCSLEGAAPPTDTLQELKDKFGSLTPLDEDGWDNYTGQGVVFRKATGQYYEILLSMAGSVRVSNGETYRRYTSTRSHTSRGTGSSGTAGQQTIRPAHRQNGADSWENIGSNYFTRDRKNAPDSEEFAPVDLMPPMVFVNGFLMPYIGERKHRHTTYQDSAVDDEQDIMVCEFAGLSVQCNRISNNYYSGNTVASAGGHYYYGTTQPFDNAGAAREGGNDLSPEVLFSLYFTKYNQMLLDNRIEVAGQFDIPIQELLNYQMYRLKLYGGQRMLPTYMRYEVGRKIRCLEAKFLLVKDFSDSVIEESISIPTPSYKWVIDNSAVNALIAAVKARHPEVTADIGLFADEEEGEETPDVFLPSPTAPGQTSPVYVRKVKAGYYQRNHGGSSGTETITYVNVESGLTVNVWFNSTAV